MKGKMDDIGQQSKPNGLLDSGERTTLIAFRGDADFLGGGDKRNKNRFLARFLGVYADDSSVHSQLSERSTARIHLTSTLCLMLGVGIFVYELINVIQAM